MVAHQSPKKIVLLLTDLFPMISFNTILKYLSSYRFSRYMKIMLFFFDLILLYVAYEISYSFRLILFDFKELSNIEDDTLFVLSIFIWSGIVIFKDAYKIIRIEKVYITLSRTIIIVLIHLGIVTLFIVFLNFDNISRLRLLGFYFVFLCFILFFRIIFLKILKYARLNGYNSRYLIIIASDDQGEQINEILNNDLSTGYKVHGVFNSINVNNTYTSNLLGRLEDVENYLKYNEVSEIFVSLNRKDSDFIPKLIIFCEKYMIRLKIIPNFHTYTKSRRVNIDFYENTPVLMLRREPLTYITNRLIKRIFDIVFSLLIIIFIFTWLFPILSILVKLSSKGPIFFKQKRTGEFNITFSCLKFRTMKVNLFSDSMQSKKNDERITKIGVFMRRTNLDELPQFFNVLIGQMSVVGPRPHMLKHTEKYSLLINNYLMRHFVNTGITGWAQVNGYRGETKELNDMKNRIEFDIWYIENWTFLLDIKIIWMTVTNMLKGEKNAN